MSQFKSTLKTEQLGRTTFKLINPLVFETQSLVITVPSGYITNFASLGSLHNIFLFPLYALMSGYGNYASTIHDYLYSEGSYSRKECDDIFYVALRAEGVARWRAYLFWLGVRLGGKSHYIGKIHK